MKPGFVLDLLFYGVGPYMAVAVSPHHFLEFTLSPEAKAAGANHPFSRYLVTEICAFVFFMVAAIRVVRNSGDEPTQLALVRYAMAPTAALLAAQQIYDLTNQGTFYVQWFAWVEAATYLLVMVACLAARVEHDPDKKRD
eukprot:TRINITY_DN7992_c0_g1_i2.p2 TRINITY_DN7992_c0_g1~~TRINITY_DN7992_c0_g1_i2.p2  ORF type:complete len:140 (+),score=34.32 TRINITY_DN7992_c0_g1_i2:168-587(+)